MAVTTEDFEMTNVCISEDQQEISEGTGPPIEESGVNFKEAEPALCDLEPITTCTDIEAPPPKPIQPAEQHSNDVEM